MEMIDMFLLPQSFSLCSLLLLFYFSKKQNKNASRIRYHLEVDQVDRFKAREAFDH